MNGTCFGDIEQALDSTMKEGTVNERQSRVGWSGSEEVYMVNCGSSN